MRTDRRFGGYFGDECPRRLPLSQRNWVEYRHQPECTVTLPFVPGAAIVLFSVYPMVRAANELPDHFGLSELLWVRIASDLVSVVGGALLGIVATMSAAAILSS